MALSAAERAQRYRDSHRAEVNARANAFYHRHRERLLAERADSAFRAKRAAYMRMYRLANRILLEQFTQRLRRAA